MAKNSTGANLGFEDKLWAAADKLRGNMDINWVRLSIENNCRNHSGGGYHGH